MEFATKCLHGGYEPKNGEPGALPIYLSAPALAKLLASFLCSISAKAAITSWHAPTCTAVPLTF